jgi:alpha-tubulin suppressor-like RCC1 family protein
LLAVCALICGCSDRPLYLPLSARAVTTDLAVVEESPPDLGAADASVRDSSVRDFSAPDFSTDLRVPADLGARGDLATPGAVMVSAGGYHSCAIVHGGEVECWGEDSSGQCGPGRAANLSALTPTPVSLPSAAVAVSAGWYHSCAIDSAGAVECWGDNSSGQLGDGHSNNPAQPSPVGVTGLSSGVTAVSAGGGHTCAVAAGGALKCWGENQSGQLGDGTTLDSSTPVDVVGLSSGVVAVAAGVDFSCAITTGGALLCWGNNDWGKLGDGTITNRQAPVAVSGLSSGVVAVNAANVQSCAVLSSGALKCWGWGGGGYATVPTDVDTYTLTKVDAVGVANGTGHVCYLTSAGAVGCLGDSLYTNALIGAQTLTSGVVSISSKQDHSCAVLSDGTIWC